MKSLFPASRRALAAALVLTAAATAACGDGEPTGTARPVASVRVSPEQHALVVGQTVRLEAMALAADGDELEDRGVTWRSENATVATVDARGVVEARAAGAAAIVATSGRKQGRSTIVVSAAPPGAVATVTVDAPAVALTAGQTRQLAATLTDAHGNVLAGRVVTWTSDNEAAATVSPTGLVTAVAAGNAILTVASEGKSTHATVAVSAPPPALVASVTLDAATVSLEEGATRQLIATPRDAQGTPIGGLGMVWSSGDVGVAQVNALGVVTGVRSGTATITVKVHGQTAQAAVTVAASYGFDLLYSVRTADVAHELFRLDVRQGGTAPARLFPAQQWASQARPSPDGGKIAFVCPHPFSGDRSICVADRDGGNSKLIASAGGESFEEPTWSPDGSKIAYVRTRAEGSAANRSRVWVMNADGTGQTLLTADMGPVDQRMPAWSPRLADGTERIAFTQDINGQPRIWSMRPDGTDKRQITTAAGAYDIQPAWSPDGRTIAFQRTAAAIFGDLWLVDAAGGNERAVMPFFPLPGAQFAPAWSPDGRLIAFLSTHETYGTGQPLVYQVYTVWADGSKLARRTSDAGDKFAPVWLPRR